MKPLPSSRAYAGWLAIVRILTGVMWLAHGIPKFTQSARFMPPNGAMPQYVARGLQSTTGAYHEFLAGVVQPNLPLFAELVRLGEVLVGVSLVLGALTRVGGLVGIVLTLDYIAARGHMLSSATLQSADLGLLVLSLISLVLPTGRVLGIDALFVRRRPAPATVRAEFVPEPPLRGPTAPPNP
ncbi:MAG: DoxX family protein [Candidatus Tumulicola sp.]